jgi:hypothetical protein
MVRNGLHRGVTARSSAAVDVPFHEQEASLERGVDLLLVSGVILLHDCSTRTWEFDVD